MKTFKQILESAKRTERLQRAISTDKLINRLGNISGRLNKGTISHTEAGELYDKEVTRVRDIKDKLK